MQAELAASALDWWREAGVGALVSEEPRDWLKPPRPAPEPAAAEAALATEVLPDTLDAFHAWLATAPLPFPSAGGARLISAGDPQAGLMVMVAMPTSDGGWFEGEAGPLFDRMLGAMNGLGRDRIYLSGLAPARPLGGRLDPASLERLAAIARHHVGLVRPRTLLLFGDDCSNALLGAPVAGARKRWHELDTPSGPVRTVATIRPEGIGGRKPIRQMVWEDLQLVMEELQR